MKYKYDFCNEAVEIDVPEEWAQVLQNLDREEYNNNHKETRRHSSLEVFDPDDWHMASPDDVEEEVISVFNEACIKRALPKLSASQRYLIEQVYFAKRSYSDIAREEGKTCAAIMFATERALHLLKEKLLKMR